MSKRRRRTGSSSNDARSDTGARVLPRYRVVLNNNAAQALMFVVQTVMELTRLCREEATHKMWEAHHTGRSSLLTTHLERAELYVEQFVERGLTVSLEPVQ
jgi:ATP-dependent Clp protease adaptor protein ClpS